MTVREIFDAAMELTAPDEVAALLDSACAGRPEVRLRVEQLLQSARDAGSFLDQPALAAPAAARPAVEAADPLRTRAGVSPPAERSSQQLRQVETAETRTFGPHGPPDTDTRAVPETFGRYRILRLLGRGGMGDVFLAHDTKIGRDVALKIPQLDGRPGDDERIQRFYREARSAGKLHHPNICDVYDVGDIDGVHYLSMRYVDGRPLSKFISADKPQSLRTVVAIVCKLALALAEAHRHGVVHRDLKPANVMIDAKGEPIVMDFGLARQLSGTGEKGMTQDGMIVGTPTHMSPEQVIGEPDKVGVPCDVWGLGVILFELVTGRLPYDGSIMEILGAIQHVDAPPLSRFRPDAPESLTAICRKMLCRDVAGRYPTMNEVADALAAFLASPAANLTEPAPAFKPLAADIPPAPAAKSEPAADARTSTTSASAAADRAPSSQRDRRGSSTSRRASRAVLPDAPPAVSSRTCARPTRPAGVWSTWRRPAALGGAALGLVLLFGVMTLFFKRGDVTLKIELDESLAKENVSVGIDGEFVEIRNLGQTIRVKPGVRKLEIRRGDERFTTDEFTLARGEKPVLRITLVEQQMEVTRNDGTSPPQPVAGARTTPTVKSPPEPTASVAHPKDTATVLPDATSTTKPIATKPAFAVPWLDALKRDGVSQEGLAAAGGGDPEKAPPELVAVLGDPHPVQRDIICCVAYSPDGKWLASAGLDRTIFVWETTTGMVKQVLRGHEGIVMSVAFSKDGKTIVSAGSDETIRLWPWERDGKVEIVKPELGPIWQMAVSADGRYVAAGGTNRKIKLWNWGKWDAPIDLPPATGPVFLHLSNGSRNAALAFSDDGEHLAISAAGTEASPKDKQPVPAPIQLLRTSDRKVVRTFLGHSTGQRSAQTLAFSRDGQWLISHAESSDYRIWDVANGKLVSGGFAELQHGAFALSPDKKTLALTSWGLTYKFDPLTKENRRHFAGGSGAPYSQTFSPDGKTLAAGDARGGVWMWDTSTWELKHLERGHRHMVTGIALSRDSRRIITAGNDFTLRKWELDQPDRHDILGRFTRWPTHVAFSPDGSQYGLVAGNTYFDIADRGAVFRTSDGNRLFTVDPVVSFERIAFSPDGRSIAGCDSLGHVHLWDARTGSELHRTPPLGISLGDISYSTDGKLVAAAGREKNVAKVWNVDSGAEAHSFDAPAPVSLALSTEAGVLATGHADGTINLWSLGGKTGNRTLRGSAALVRTLKFSADGRTLVAAFDDGTLRVWNPKHDRSRQVIPLGPPNQQLHFDLDASGRYVVAGGKSPAIFVLKLDEPEKAAAAASAPATNPPSSPSIKPGTPTTKSAPSAKE